MSQVDQVAPNGIVNLNDAPAPIDDATFDSLFPAEAPSQVTALQPQPAAQPQGTPPPAPAQPQVAAPSNQPFLKGDKSVYNSPDAAIEGINQKDALIEQLRQRYALTTGIDPITGQPVQATNAQPISNDYTTNRQQYMTDLYEAAKNSPEAYVDVQQKFVMDTLGPLQPLIQRYAREQALQTLSAELPDAPKFVGTPVYQRALDANPELKNAIAVAESDIKWHSRLPGLYKLAYLTGQGLQLPDLLKAQQAQPVAAATQNPPVQHRPTAQSTTPSMPTNTAKPSFKTLDGIKATIADFEARGHKLEF